MTFARLLRMCKDMSECIALRPREISPWQILLKAAKNQLMRGMDVYMMAANKEIAKIDRVKENQTKLVGYVRNAIRK